jgi:nucleotide-binding universal stress UspA family protein
MKILLATDGSRFANAATQAVIAHVKCEDAELQVINVVNTMNCPFPEIAEYDAGVEQASNPRLKPAQALVEATAKLLSAEGLNATTLILWGDPREEILEAAKKWPADLIVLGSHGETGLKNLFMGSVSDAVARHATCSVEIVRIPKDRLTHDGMRILLAVDDSRFSEAAANAVLTQIKPNSTDVKLIRVLEPFPIDEAEKMGTKDYPDFVEARAKLRDQAKQKLMKTAEKLLSAGFKATQVVEEGDARDLILDHAERWSADLIVAGSRGLRGLKRFLMGSVSEAITHYAGCSVEIVRIRVDY